MTTLSSPPAAPPAEAAPSRSRAIVRVVNAGVVVVLLGALGMALLSAQKRLEPPKVFGQVPAFRLEDHEGRAVTSDDLRGTVYIADFIFTSCSGQCHGMSTRMAKLQQELANRPDLKLISITVDPDVDTRERLAGYAKEYGAEEGRWLFLRGDTAAVRELCARGFLLAVAEGKPDDPEQIIHSDRFVLVDQQGRLRGFYSSSDEEALTRLKKDLRPLLEGPIQTSGG